MIIFVFYLKMTIGDLQFKPFISQLEIDNCVKKLAEQIHDNYANTTPTFLVILNGAFMFAADLLKHYKGDCRISFMRLSSYQGTQSTGQVKNLIEADNLDNKDIIIVEDIVDTGHSMDYILDYLETKNIKSKRIVSLFHKPDAYLKNHHIDYIGKIIPDKFIVGYGLDYNGLGRNLPDVYQLKSS